MRKSVFFILLATAAMPALASAQNEDRDGDRRAARAERSDSDNGQRSQRAVRSERVERSDSDKGQRSQRAVTSERAVSGDGAAAVQRVERSERVRVPRAERSQQAVQTVGQSTRRERADNQSNERVRPALVARRDTSERVTNWRARERRVSGANSPTIPATTPPTISRGGESGNGSGIHWRERSRDDHGRRWSSDWRKDNRYNWRHHRGRYSSLFRLGRYYDPFGYGYRRFSIGFNLWPSYYGNNFWLNDPWQYRLPPAYGPYRWIRYYDDALLVNIYDGQVVDVIHNFFW